MKGPSAAEGKKLEIRKYPNRRYYDATHSRHLTLEEIRDLVRDGFDIRVIDSKSNADITGQVLTQIILELDTPKIATLPVAMLVQMIRANERVVDDFISDYFEQAFKTYVEYQKQMQERFRNLHSVPGSFGPMNAFAQFFNPFGQPSNGGAQPPPEPQPSPAGDADLRSIIADLREQVKELQRKRSAPAARRRKAS